MHHTPGYNGGNDTEHTAVPMATLMIVCAAASLFGLLVLAKPGTPTYGTPGLAALPATGEPGEWCTERTWAAGDDIDSAAQQA